MPNATEFTAAIATRANMQALWFEEDNVFAYSTTTGEEHSADPSDYCYNPEDEPIRDANGNPMILCKKITMIQPLKVSE